jgi:ATP-binding cassette subfamily A (ABC1) protein 3
LTLESDPEISINLELNSLEDAFINIGMDEEKYLRAEDASGESSSSK